MTLIDRTKAAIANDGQRLPDRWKTVVMQILDLHTPYPGTENTCPQCGWSADRLGRPCSTVMLIAAGCGLVPQEPQGVEPWTA